MWHRKRSRTHCPNPETHDRLLTAQRAEKEQQSRLEEEQRIIRQLREIRRKNGLTEALTRVLKEGY